MKETIKKILAETVDDKYKDYLRKLKPVIRTLLEKNIQKYVINDGLYDSIEDYVCSTNNIFPIKLSNNKIENVTNGEEIILIAKAGGGIAYDDIYVDWPEISDIYDQFGELGLIIKIYNEFIEEKKKLYNC